MVRLVSLTTAAMALMLPATATAFDSLPRSTAAERQVDAAQLAAAFQEMQQLGYVKGTVVARDGYVVGEEHWVGEATDIRPLREATMSVTSTLVGIAIEHGFLKGSYARLVDHLPPHLVPSDQAKREIRIYHLLTHTSGLEWDENSDLVPWINSADPVAGILDRRLEHTPGTRYNVNTAAVHLLSVVLTEATGMSTLEFADAYLFGPLGISERTWLVTGGYHNGGQGLSLRTEDLAKLGVLVTGGGSFGGRRILSDYWTEFMTWPTVFNVGTLGPLTERHLGFLWFIDRVTTHELFTAWGHGGQFVLGVPSLGLVVATHAVETGSAYVAARQEAAILDVVVNRIIPATTDRRVMTFTGQEVPELAEVDDMMQDLLQDHDIPSATVAVAKDGRLVLARGYTWDEPEMEPVEPTALYRIGSIGKAITSTAVHQLIERGLLRHDTPVASTLGLEPLPGEQAHPWLDEVTVDHLLTHTGGWDREVVHDPINWWDHEIAAAVGGEPPPSPEEVTAYMTGKPLQFVPGTVWSYSNYGYLLLDMLIEQHTGEDYVEYMLDHVYRPLGIGRARVAHTLPSELAPTEVRYDNGWEGDPYTANARNAAAAGAFVMAAPDMARFFSALFDDESSGGLLSEDTRADMLSMPFPACDQVGYGRGWMHEEMFFLMGHTAGWLTDLDDDLTVYAHGGGGMGVHTLALWRSDGIVFVTFTNHDPVAEHLIFPEITVWPDHDLWQSVGVSTDPVGAAPTESWIPVVASSEGVGGSVWRSDVGLLNRSTLDNQVRLRLYTTDGFLDHESELAPGEYRTVDDVMADFEVTGSGPLRVFSSEPLTVSSRTYSLSEAGTFGQFLDATPPTLGLNTAHSATLVGLVENDDARSNIGLLNGWKRTAEVEVALYDGDGSLLATLDVEVPPEQTVQLNRPFLSEAGRAAITSGYAVVTVRFGRNVLAYASVVDNVSNDPTTIPMKRGAGDTTLWVAAAAHADGAHGSVWRTDLALLNRSGEAAAAELILHADSGDEATSTVTVADGEQRVLTDVIHALGAAGAGAVRITSDRPLLAASRTYNVGADGTFGQFLDGVPDAGMAGAGDQVYLPQLRQDELFRTNIGLVNTGTTAAEVVVSLRDAAGAELAAESRTLAPRTRVQINQPFARLAGRDDLEAAWAVVTVSQGEGVVAYASVVDNATNDPTTVSGMR